MKKTFITLLVTAVAFGVCGFCGLPKTDAAQAFELYDLFTEEHILIYENDIAKCKVVSNLSDAQLAKTALNYNVSADKLKKMMVFQHAMKCAGYDFSVTEIKDMQQSDLIKNAKIYIEWLKQNRTEEEMSAIAKKFKGIA